MVKQIKLFTIFLMLSVLATACNQQEKSILPVQAAFDEASQAKADGLDQFFQKKADDGELSGAVIVFQDGQILLNKGYGYSDRSNQTPVSYGTRFRLDHATMPFTSLAIWMLYDQGKLDIQDAICGYIDECPETWEAITILDLLNNTSRIPDYTFQSDFHKNKGDEVTLDELVNQIKKLPLDDQLFPINWNGDSNYILLGAILERVTEQRYETFIQKNILTPLNLKNTGLIHGTGEKDNIALQYLGAGDKPTKPLDMSNLYSAGGMYSTIEESYLFLDAMINRKFLNSDKMQALTEGKDLFTWWTENSQNTDDFFTQASGWLSFPFYEGGTHCSLFSLIDQKGSVFAYRPDSNSGFIILVNQESTPFTWGEYILPILEGSKE